MSKITITIDSMLTSATPAQLLRELAAMIGESTDKELDRPNNNWHAELSSVRISVNL